MPISFSLTFRLPRECACPQIPGHGKFLSTARFPNDLSIGQLANDLSVYGIYGQAEVAGHFRMLNRYDMVAMPDIRPWEWGILSP